MQTFLEYLAEATQNNDAKIKIVAIQGSPRTKNSCSGGDSKTAFLIKKAIDDLPKYVKVDVIDLKVDNDKPQVRPCKGCVGTANGFQCHYPCSCFSKDDGTDDLMYQQNVYKKLENADGFAVFTPVQWFGPSSQVKAMFDRLVCINLTLSLDDAKKIMGEDYKNPKVTTKTELSGEYESLLKNHYEGKVAAFFVQGDDGANDYKGHKGKMPLSMLEDRKSDYIGPREAIEPLVKMCRYSGIFVPETCIEAVVFGYGQPYAQNNIDAKKSEWLIERSCKLLNNLVKEIKKRKK